MFSVDFHWWHVGVLVVLAACVFDKSSAQFVTVSCYECTNCTDPFSASGIYVASSCNSCYKMSVDIAYAPYRYVVRRCVAACLETSQTFGGGTVETKCCATGLCNAGTTLKRSMASGFTLGLFVLLHLLRRIY